MEKTLKQKVLTVIKEYVLITFGLALYAFAFSALISKSHTVPGGAAGISSLIFYGIGGEDAAFTLGNIYFIINVVLLVLGLIIIGPKFGAKTIYAIFMISILMNLCEWLIPENFTGLSSEAGDQLLMVILGGVLCGLGVGLCFAQGGSTGGTDIIAMIINKYKNISYGKILMGCDVVIVTASVFVFDGDLKPAIYGVVVITAIGNTVDMVLSGSRQSTQITVHSIHNKVIGDRIITEAKRGVTYMLGEGGYSGAEQKVLSVVCRKTEQAQIYKIIKEEDPQAFIVAAAVTGAYGQGFEALRTK